MILYLGAESITKNYLQMEDAKLPLIILAPSVFIVSIEAVLKGYFNGREKMKATANSQSIEQIIKAIFTILIVEILGYLSNENTIIMVCGASIATTISTFFSLFYLYINFIKIKKTIWIEMLSSTVYKKERIGKILKQILKVVIPISLGNLLAATNKTIDAFTVVRLAKGMLGENEAVLQYGILTGKIDTLIALPYAFNIAFATTLIPSISRAMAKHDNQQAREMIKFSIIAAILIGLPCSIIMCIFSKPILGLLFPRAATGSEMLSLSALSIILVLLIQTVNGALQGLKKFKEPIQALAVGCITKLILNIVLIPIKNIGIYGAIMASIISYLITLIIMFIKLKKVIALKISINKFFLKPIIATIIMGITSLNIYNKFQVIIGKNFSLIFSLIIGTIIYILFIVLLRIISKEDMKIVLENKINQREIRKIEE